jgi:hypothetical protein
VVDDFGIGRRGDAGFHDGDFSGYPIVRQKQVARQRQKFAFGLAASRSPRLTLGGTNLDSRIHEMEGYRPKPGKQV